MIDHLPDVVEPRLVRQDLTDGDVRLAGATELRPVAGHPIVVIEQAAIHHHVQQRGGDALGGRKAGGHRVARPRLARLVADPAPEVHYAGAAVVHAHPGAAGILAEDVAKDPANEFEAGMQKAVDGDLVTVAQLGHDSRLLPARAVPPRPAGCGGPPCHTPARQWQGLSPARV